MPKNTHFEDELEYFHKSMSTVKPLSFYTPVNSTPLNIVQKIFAYCIFHIIEPFEFGHPLICTLKCVTNIIFTSLTCTILTCQYLFCLLNCECIYRTNIESRVIFC